MKTPNPPFFRRVSLTTSIAIAMFLGAGAGLMLGPRADPLGGVGKSLITLIKAFATPLLFLAVFDAVSRTHIHPRAFGRLIFISMLNATAALAIGIGISIFLRPGDLARQAGLGAFSRSDPQTASAMASAPKSLEFSRVFESFVPKSIVEPFSQNTVLTLVVLALLFGFALRLAQSRAAKEDAPALEALSSLSQALLRVFEALFVILLKVIPVAVFCVVAKTVGHHGLSAARGLGIYVAFVIAGLLVQIVFIYNAWILLLARKNFSSFWRCALEPVTYALGASSSLATLPVTLRAIRRAGISDSAGRLSACVGTNLNNDGILLYEGMAVFFVAQLHQIQMTPTDQIAAAMSCVVAGLGIAGIPEAGLISLAVVLGTVGLPTESLPFLLSVDWILSRARAATNVIADMVGAQVLDSLAHPTGAKRRD